MNEIQIISEYETKGNVWSVKGIDIETPEEIKLTDLSYIGIDPGVTNVGMAFIEDKVTSLLQIKIERHKDPLDRVDTINSIMTSNVHIYGDHVHVTVEGAAFGNPYRQVELAEARITMAYWFYHRLSNVEIIVPQSIRKVAFGSAKIKNPWDNIPDDAAAALGCALWGYKTYDKSF